MIEPNNIIFWLKIRKIGKLCVPQFSKREKENVWKKTIMWMIQFLIRTSHIHISHEDFLGSFSSCTYIY